MEGRDKPYYISNRLREFAFVGGRTGDVRLTAIISAFC